MTASSMGGTGINRPTDLSAMTELARGDAESVARLSAEIAIPEMSAKLPATTLLRELGCDHGGLWAVAT